MHEAKNKAMDLLGRIDTAALCPVFVEKLNALLNACAERGQLYVATSGLRTYEEQDALFAKGRSMPGGVVTNARAGQSMHNFGIAADFAPHVGAVYAGKLQPEYSDKNYRVLGDECPKHGLEWGGRWAGFRDTPHVQLPLPKAVRLRDLDLWMRTSGIAKTWEMLLSR